MDPEVLKILLIIIAGLVVLFITGMPVAFCFITITLGGVIYFWGSGAGIPILIQNVFSSISTFTLLPIIMFVFLGQVMFRSDMAFNMLNTLDKWLGRLPGRLAILSVLFSALFATMSGSQMASASMLGSILVPDMQKRGYSKTMTIGPIMGAGGLAMIIPPSNLGILLAVVGGMSVAKLLMAGLLPGIMLACFYLGYVVIRCKLQPHLAPPYEVKTYPIKEKIVDACKYVLPLTLIIVLVLVFMFIGWATPTESAVLGAMGALILAICYRKFNYAMLKNSLQQTVKISVNVLFILTGATTFSQILAFSGATQELASYISSLPYNPIVIVIVMQLLVLILGCFMDSGSIIMVTIPIFMPIVRALELDPIWFGLLFLINIEVGSITPPMGLMLFVMKSVSPSDVTMGDIYKAGMPYVLCDLLGMAVIIIFPTIALLIPSMMSG